MSAPSIKSFTQSVRVLLHQQLEAQLELINHAVDCNETLITIRSIVKSNGATSTIEQCAYDWLIKLCLYEVYGCKPESTPHWSSPLFTKKSTPNFYRVPLKDLAL